ncbi:TPA: hypothetical protein I2T40_10840 [Staphylococcus aureus]|nr:hypothetical protein [Staphylococcus aureus]
MLTITRYIEKRIIPPFLIAFLIEIIFKILFSIWDDSKLDMIHGVWIMISTSLLVVYSLYDMYNLVYSRKFYFYYTTKYNIKTILLVHTVLYIVNNFIFYLLYVNYDNSAILGKLISLVSFYIFNLALLLICRHITNIRIGSIFYLLILTFFTLVYPILFISINQSNDVLKQFMIGAVNSENIFQIYTFLIPITILNGSKDALIDNTLLINVIITIFSLILYLIFKGRKYNW